MFELGFSLEEHQRWAGGGGGDAGKDGELGCLEWLNLRACRWQRSILLDNRL